MLPLLAACASTHAPASTSVDADLPTEAPEAAGYSSSALAQVGTYAASIHSPAGVLIVADHVVYTWGDPTAKMQVHSIRKSFLSSLYGSAVDGGAIDLDSTLAQLAIDDLPPSLTGEEMTATVRDLIEARSGVYHVANYESASEIANRPARGSHAPGTFWYYNNWDFNVAGAIYEQETGTSIFDAFATQIAGPIGMQDYSAADGTYEIDTPEESKFRAYLFAMSSRDMARFGLLYLHGGVWNGTQVVPADWFAASTRSYSDTGTTGIGYGYLWWVATAAGVSLFHDVDLGTGAVAAEGSGGHYIVVLPSYDMVLVVRADDAYYEQDETDNNIGPNRMGMLVSLILAAKQ